MDTYPPIEGWTPNTSVWHNTCTSLRNGGFRVSEPTQRRERMRSQNRETILLAISRSKSMSASEVAERIGVHVKEACAMLYGLTQRRLLVKRGRQNYFRYSLAPAGEAMLRG